MGDSASSGSTGNYNLGSYNYGASSPYSSPSGGTFASTGSSTSNYNDLISASSSLVRAGSDISGSISKSKALSIQGNYTAQMDALNAQFADAQAADALARGDRAASGAIKQGKQAVGKIRTSQAAQGVEVNSGSAAQVAGDANLQAVQNSVIIKNNAWREAWGYQSQALNYNAQGAYASNAAEFNSGQTLLTGGMNAASELAAGAYKGYRNGLSFGGN